VGGAIAVSGNRTFAQITPDATLGAERSIVNLDVSNGLPREQIEGGAIRGINLFHSFQEFNLSEGQSVYFQNPAGIENIISRVTGGNPSDIRGTLGVSGGTANLFLLNPSGIIFGANARLDVRGSFVATTANAIQFGTQSFFNSSDPNPPLLLTVNPSAFFFNQVAHGSIVNRSIAPSNAGVQGLQVADGRSLLLLGGNVSLESGRVNALGGRVELGGVAGAGTVGLSVDGNDLHLSFPDGMARSDVSLTDGARVNASGEGGGTIQVQGRRVLLSGGSQMAAVTQGAKPGRDLTVNASESVELVGYSRGYTITTRTLGAGHAGDITINTGKLLVRDGAQVSTLALGEGSAGQLRVNASESVELIGAGIVTGIVVNSGLLSFTTNAGDAGNLTINTKRLIVRDRAVISTESASIFTSGQLIPATGQGGNLTVNASESVELTESGRMFANTQGTGNAGNLTINTARLLVQSDSRIFARSTGSGKAGNIYINVRETLQANNGIISTRSEQSSGGAIDITAGDIRLQSNSDITTFVSKGAGGGGNITLNARSIIALDDSDILAFSQDGRGGNITLNTPGFFGFRYAPAPPSTNPNTLDGNEHVDINASGALSSGTITLPNVNPSQGLVALPTNVIDASELITNSCIGRSNRREDKFIITGRGGLPPNPRQVLRSQAVQVDWVTLDAGANNPTEDVQSRGRQRRVSDEPDSQIDNNVNTKTTEIVEAQGWVVDANGKIVLVATAPTANPHSPWFTPASCPVR
jgi:filamentous hemagglutinin family protein